MTTPRLPHVGIGILLAGTALVAFAPTATAIDPGVCVTNWLAHLGLSPAELGSAWCVGDNVCIQHPDDPYTHKSNYDCPIPRQQL